jgi:transcriptional regulator with XRE-family HTH domain
MSDTERYLTALGDKIRETRMALGLSQEQLADQSELDRTYISLVERGRRNPSFTNLIKVADGLGTTVSALTEGI